MFSAETAVRRGFGLCMLLLAVACDHDGGRDSRAVASSASLEARITAAEALYFGGEYDTAREAFRELLNAAQRSSDPSVEPKILTWLGLAAWRLGDFHEAREFGEQALAMKQERGLRDEIARSYNALGLLAWHEGRLTVAAELFGRSRVHAEAVDDEAGIGRAVGNLGLIQVELADFDGGRASFSAAAEAGKRLGDVRMEANALANQAMLHILVGETGSALPLLASARVLYTSIGYLNGEQNVLGQLATAYISRGQHAEGFATLDTALSLVRQQGLVQEVAAYLELMGNAYAELGDMPRALQHLGEARALADSLGLALQYGTALRSEAAVHARQGNLAHAQASVTKALATHQRERALVEEMDDRLLLAEILNLDGRSDSAYLQLREAEALARSLASSPALLSVRLAHARIADRLQRAPEVLRALAGPPADWRTLDASSWWEPHALRARAFAALGDYDSAIVSGREAVAAIERVRRNVHAAPVRTAFLSHRASAYADLVLSLLRAGRVEEAFETADAARGRALLDHLAGARTRLAEDSATEKRLNQLLRQIDILMRRVAELERAPEQERGTTALAHGEFMGRLRLVRSEYEALLQRQWGLPKGGTGTPPSPGSLRSVQHVLNPGEVLVQYIVTDERLLLLAVTSKSVRWLERDVSRDQLRSAVRLVRELISRPDPSGHGSTALGTLREVLFDPLLKRGIVDGAHTLIVVPHDALAYLPFAAVRDLGGQGEAPATFSIITLPSAAALTYLRARERELTGQPVRLRATSFAPFPDRLPATRREVLEIRRELGGGVTINRMGPRATESFVRRALSAPGIVHIASHGIMNPHNPMFSRVEVARGRGAMSDDDGRLEVHEVLDLTISSRLVFLSGCETGLGGGWSTDYAMGEDFTTLGQAFLLAGAANVIATLWRIEDAGAAEFARHFYRHLREHPPAAALAMAQWEMQREARYRHPYYWAGYTLAGSGASMPIPSSHLVPRTARRPS